MISSPVNNDDSQLLPENYRFLQDFVYKASGIVLEADKHYLLNARLLGLVREYSLRSLNELCNQLRIGPDSVLRQRVVDGMTTNETYFQREPAHYEALRQTVIPALLKERDGTRKLRFWSAACSTGQEAYTLAMMLLDMGLGNWNIEILGTDLNSAVLERARTGRFSQLEVNRGLPAGMLVKHFHRSGLEWQIKDDVRRLTRFQSFDLRSDTRTLGPFDVVFCRNVLIYFDAITRENILRQIHGTLSAGGYLLLGSTETAIPLGGGFERRPIGQALFCVAV